MSVITLKRDIGKLRARVDDAQIAAYLRQLANQIDKLPLAK